jgi:hypothetical protein
MKKLTTSGLMLLIAASLAPCLSQAREDYLPSPYVTPLSEPGLQSLVNVVGSVFKTNPLVFPSDAAAKLAKAAQKSRMNPDAAPAVNRSSNAKPSLDRTQDRTPAGDPSESNGTSAVSIAN